MAARCGHGCSESFPGVGGWWEHLRECLSHPARPKWERRELIGALDRREAS